MKSSEVVTRDERTFAVENASFRLGYVVLNIGLLAAFGYRTLVRHEAPWDLLALWLVSGIVPLLYQDRQKATPHSRTKRLLLIALIWGIGGGIIGAIISLVGLQLSQPQGAIIFGVLFGIAGAISARLGFMQ